MHLYENFQSIIHKSLLTYLSAHGLLASFPPYFVKMPCNTKVWRRHFHYIWRKIWRRNSAHVEIRQQALKPPAPLPLGRNRGPSGIWLGSLAFVPDHDSFFSLPFFLPRCVHWLRYALAQSSFSAVASHRPVI
jgi:hypothetical protein